MRNDEDFEVIENRDSMCLTGHMARYSNKGTGQKLNYSLIFYQKFVFLLPSRDDNVKVGDFVEK